MITELKSKQKIKLPKTMYFFLQHCSKFEDNILCCSVKYYILYKAPPFFFFFHLKSSSVKVLINSVAPKSCCP